MLWRRDSGYVAENVRSSMRRTRDIATNVNPAAISFFPISITTLSRVIPWHLCIVIAQASTGELYKRAIFRLMFKISFERRDRYNLWMFWQEWRTEVSVKFDKKIIR